MIRALLARIASGFHSSETVSTESASAVSGSDNQTTDQPSSEDSASEGDAKDESGFTPSQLDASVLFAHGKSDETERAIADVEEQARVLEQKRRER